MVAKAFAPAVVALAFAAALAAPAGAHVDGAQHAAGTKTTLVSQMLGDVNRLRRSHGLTVLRLSPKLSAAAAQHSNEMARVGYFSHDSANGSAFWRRVQRYYPSSGRQYWSVGENLLWASPDVDAAGAVKMWLASPEHRANLLKGDWREIGLSTVHVPSAPGVYHGLEVTIVTADFGVRK